MTQSDSFVDKSKNDFSKKNNSTISTKNSKEQLICKSPQSSPQGTLKNIKGDKCESERDKKKCPLLNTLLFACILQVVFGILMVVFGGLVIEHKAHLGYIAGGIWGGCFATATGIVGVVTALKGCSIFKRRAQRVTQTIFLAMSLITLAVSQLVLVVAAIGMARDLRAEQKNDNETTTLSSNNSINIEIPKNYMQLLFNAALVLACCLECLCTAVSSYKVARKVCPCFKDAQESMQEYIPEASKDQFISSWLGKHTAPQPFFVVTAPAAPTKPSKMQAAIPAVFTLPPHMIQPPPQLMGYPLIPAPLGTVPSPIIAPDPKEMILPLQNKKHPRHRSSFHPHKSKQQMLQVSRKSTKTEPKQITEEELARTYTGLDRTIAEEFIQISESQNTSICSSSSLCNSACNGGCNECTCTTSSSSSSNSNFVSEL